MALRKVIRQATGSRELPSCDRTIAPAKESIRSSTHTLLSVTVNPPLLELSPTELTSVESNTDGVVTMEKVVKGRLEITVMVTRGWLHSVELRTGLADVDRLNGSQLAPVPNKDNVEFMAGGTELL